MASKRDTLIASAEKSLARGRVEAALSDYQKVLEEVSGDIGILNKVGDLLVRLNRNEESLPYFNRIAEHYAKDGFYVKAIAMYKKVNRLDPSRLEVYERLAELYSKQGLGMEAKSQYQVLADHYLKQDNAAGATAILQKMVQADPTNIQLHVKLADLFTQTRRVPEALKECAIVAGMLRERSAHAEAIQVYEKALNLAPDNLEILKAVVPLLLETGNAAGARACLRRALQTTPRSIPLFLLAAEAALMANDLVDARNFATKAQAVDPENEEVLNAVVKVQLRARRPDLAFPAAATLADLAVRHGESKKALGILAPLAKAAPDNAELLKKIVDISVAAGDEAGAVPYRSALAECLRKEGKLAESAELLRICARLVPDHAEFRTRLAALEPLLAPPASGSTPMRRDEMAAAHDRALTIPGFVVPRPAPAPPVEAEAPAPPAPPAMPPPERNEFEFDLEVLEAPSVEAAAPRPAALPEEVITPEEPPAAAGAVTTPEEPLPAFAQPEEPPLSAAGEVVTPEELLAADVQPEEPFLAAVPGPVALPEEPAPAAPEARVEEVEEAIEIVVDETPASPVPASRDWQPVSTPGVFEPTGEYPSAVDFGSEPPPPVQAMPEAASAPVDAIEAMAAMELLESSPATEEFLHPPPAAPHKSAEEIVVDEALVEAEVFRKYGLLDKAVEKLRPVTREYPESSRAREKLFELLLELGRTDAAQKEAEALKSLYEAEGRTDRIRGMEDLLGGPIGIPLRPHPRPASAGATLTIPDFSGTPPLRPVRPVTPDQIDVSQLTPKPFPAPKLPKGRPAPAPTLPDELQGLVKPARTPAPPVPSPARPPAATHTFPAGLVPIVEAPHQARALSSGELADIDFCLDQGMVVDAAERLQALEARFPGHAEIRARRDRLGGTRGAPESLRPILNDLFGEDLESVLDAELSRALTDEMARGAAPPGPARKEAARSARSELNLDESELFSDEQEFFNLAEELQAEMNTAPLPEEPVLDGARANVSLEEIFKEFKKGVEQQLSPEDHETHYNLGIAYKEMGLTDEAIGEFQVASKDPHHAVECCAMLGLCFLEKGLLQLAIKWYRKGLDTPGISEDERLGLQYDLAGLYADQGDRDAAYRAYLDIYGTNAGFRDVGDKVKEFRPAV